MRLPCYYYVVKRKLLLPKIIFISGVMLGYLYFPISSYFGGSLDLRATIGGIIALIVGIIFAKIALANRISLKHLLIGMAMGVLIASFWVQQQFQYGHVTYVARGGDNSSPDQIDWGVHPAVAFYTITWVTLTLPALFFYSTARSKRA
jgi:hypothetical protein